ncbi:MAG TPA: energy transducer TonB, partial [Polyangiaceae bacterium]
MSYASAERVFSGGEVTLAFVVALSVQVSFFVLLYATGRGDAVVKAKEDAQPEAIPIAVKPVLDELPLLRLGGKKVRPKLPDMWKKQAPVQRFEERSAPSPMAEKTPDAIPTSKLAELDAAAPPPDAEVAKEVDQELLDAAPDAEPTVEGEGSPDGVKEGTETDPLKARAASQYLSKIMGWFNARFRPPIGEIPCEELKALSAGVAVRVGADRSVAGYTITSPSGNANFDTKVRATMDGIIGQQLPPPPPL